MAQSAFPASDERTGLLGVCLFGPCLVQICGKIELVNLVWQLLFGNAVTRKCYSKHTQRSMKTHHTTTRSDRLRQRRHEGSELSGW